MKMLHIFECPAVIRKQMLAMITRKGKRDKAIGLLGVSPIVYIDVVVVVVVVTVVVVIIVIIVVAALMGV